MRLPWQHVKENPCITIKTTAGASGKVQSSCFGYRLDVVQQVQLHSSCHGQLTQVISEKKTADAAIAQDLFG